METNQNQTLLPFAMESLGKIGKQGYDYINQVAADYGEHYKVTILKHLNGTTGNRTSRFKHNERANDGL